MFALLLVWRWWQRLAFALCRDFQVADAGLKLQQFQLLVRQFLAARSVLRDPFQTQPLFQSLDHHLRILQIALIRIKLTAHHRKQRRRKLRFQLFEKFGVGRRSHGWSGSGRRGGSFTHETD